jgi:hypothetical protein
MNGSAFEQLKRKNNEETKTVNRELMSALAQHAYLKGFEKGISVTEEAANLNNVEYLIMYFKDKFAYFKNYVINKTELLKFTYPETSHVQRFYELKGELKAIKEFGAMYLNIDFNVELQEM